MAGMPEPDLQPARENPVTAATAGFASRFADAIEIAVVALAGSVGAPVLLAALGLPPSRVLEDAAFLAIFLTVEGTLTLLLVRLLLWWRGEGLPALGWGTGRPASEVRAGLAALPVLFAATFAVGLIFRQLLPDYVTRVNPLLNLVRDWNDLGLLCITSIYVGGIKEEIQRAFVLNRFRNLGGPWLGLILWSLFFGFGHLVQGPDNAVAAGILGVLFGVLYLRRRSLTAPIVAHALYDVLTLTVYWFFVV
jgi:membrane protease YdiL (CAAX protease family)